eukprot:289228_1
MLILRSHLITTRRLTMKSHSLLTSQKIDELLKFVTSLPGQSSQQRQLSSSIDESKYDENNKFYLTTAINYTNGKPHIGHAYEAVTSDVICRYHRNYGRDVFFLTGTDEHGQKVANTAEKQNKTPKQLCDENVAVFKQLNNKLRISNDYYIRTTDSDHYELAAKMFSIAHKNGDIYYSKYEGWYDIREERFLTETQAKETNYMDPVTNKKYTKQSEESYFFRMSKYHDRLLSHIRNNPNCIQPSKSYQLILNRLTEDKLQDLCVSRSTFSWGIPVPINDKHIIYVWFDALSNYLTGIKYFNNNGGLSHYWPCNVHIIGKDIVWFHCVIWPCILMSCGIDLPLQVFCHGFVTDKDGKKMSKSVGNVIDPFIELKKYDADSLRYFIITQANFGNDLRWNSRDLEERHDAHLTHIYGNLVNRALNLCKKDCKSKIPNCESYDNIFDFNKLMNETEKAYKNFDLLHAAELTMDSLRICNDWITKKEPWKLKGEKNKIEKIKIIRSVLECIYILSHFMEPFTPRAAQQVFNDLNHNKISIREIEINGNKNNGNYFNNLIIGRNINKSSKLLFKQITLTSFEKKKVNKNKPIIARIEFKIGKIIKIDIHPNDEKLYVETIDLGENKTRNIVSGLGKYYTNKNELLNKYVIVFSNLKPSKFKGVLSEGMVMCVSNNDKSQVKILSPPNDSQIGERLTWKNIDLYQWDADERINISKKNSFWKKEIINKLITDNDGDMAFDNVKFITKTGGKSIKSPFKNSQIS